MAHKEEPKLSDMEEGAILRDKYMTISMIDEDFIQTAESTGINLETISKVAILKICHICHICMHECASESLFELYMKEQREAGMFKCSCHFENDENPRRNLISSKYTVKLRFINIISL